jgi:hypothetical protein
VIYEFVGGPWDGELRDLNNIQVAIGGGFPTPVRPLSPGEAILLDVPWDEYHVQWDLRNQRPMLIRR